MPDRRPSLDFNNRDLHAVRFASVNLSDAVFTDVDFAGSAVRDANMSATTFDDIRLRGARFTYADFGDVEIRESRLAGMSIDGILVSDLFAAYQTAKEPPS